MVSSQGWQPDCKTLKRRNGQRDWWYEQSHRDYLRSAICIITRLSWAVNHYRDNAATYKAQRDKRWTEAGERGNAWLTCRCVSVTLLRSMQNTRRDIDAKAENDASCVMMLPLVAVGCTSAVCQSVRYHASGGYQPPTAWQRWTGLFHPQREADHYAKQLEGTQKYINEQCR